MSEQEIRRRQEYKRRRKRWTIVQLVAIVLLLAIALGSFLVYNRMDQNQYIQYTENSGIDYKVQYTDNGFFEEEWIDKDKSYISSLIEGISADFSYKMDADSDEMRYDYTYYIDAKLIVSNERNGATYYTVEERILPMENLFVKKASSFEIKETVNIDFVKFDEIARSFIKTYNLTDANSVLLVTLNVETNCENNGFLNVCKNAYSTSLNIPLAEDTFSIHSTSSSAPDLVKNFEFVGSVNRSIFLYTSLVSLALAILFIITILIFLHVTKNEDITYAAKVRKIYNAYSSFIQRIYGDFNSTGYQTVPVKTFEEMLGIRDTIQSPVLMSENRDETMTRFLIPTNTKILYVFEIKVDNYDEIYAILGKDEPDKPTSEVIIEEETTPLTEEVIEETTPEAEPCEAADEVVEEVVEQTPVEEPVVEEPVVEETPVEAIEEVIPESEPIILDIQNVMDDLMIHLVEEPDENGEEGDGLTYVDDNGTEIMITCKRSFTANLIQSNPQVKKYYNEIKNFILSYMGVKSRISWRIESFNKGRTPLFKLKIRGKTICLYCALNPDDFDKSRYFHENIDSKSFAGTPMLVRIKSDRGLKRAKSLCELVMQRFDIALNPKAPIIDYAGAYPYDTTKHLVGRGLIKVLLPTATAAEPKPHHHVHKDISEKPKNVEEEVIEEVVEETPVEQIVEEPTESEPFVLDIQNLMDDLMGHLVEEPDENGEEGDGLTYVDDNGTKIMITCKRSFTANLIQSNPQVKKYYNEIKNFILSYMGVKSRISWRIESFNKGRTPLFKLKIRGKTICLYCALNPDDFDKSRYFHEKTDSKSFSGTPMLIRIRSDRGLKRAKALCELVMQRFDIAQNPEAPIIDYAGAYPYDTTKRLVGRGLVKVLLPSATAAEPKPHHHAHKDISEKPKSAAEVK